MMFVLSMVFIAIIVPLVITLGEVLFTHAEEKEERCKNCGNTKYGYLDSELTHLADGPMRSGGCLCKKFEGRGVK